MSGVKVELGELGLDEGGLLLVKRALRRLPSGAALEVHGSSRELAIHLRAWCRAEGHEISESGLVVTKGSAEHLRWAGAERIPVDPTPRAEAHWGLAARGALLEPGTPAVEFPLSNKDALWTDEAARLYAQAVAGQWDPAKAVAWDEPFELEPEVEDAVVTVMTYLIENETAALIIPARFVAKLHPHYRETMQLLAIQSADEARHIEVFTRRARLKREVLGSSTIGGQRSLISLFDEPEPSVTSFLLSVLGEGSFLSLLWFLHEHGPDPITRRIAQLSAQDEARHVAFGVAHVAEQVRADPSLISRLSAAVHRRHDALRHTAGLNAEVFDALVLMAARGWSPEQLRRGHAAVQRLVADMDDGRKKRLERVGFTPADAASLSGLHTRNFM